MLLSLFHPHSNGKNVLEIVAMLTRKDKNQSGRSHRSEILENSDPIFNFATFTKAGMAWGAHQLRILILANMHTFISSRYIYFDIRGSHAMMKNPTKLYFLKIEKYILFIEAQYYAHVR